MNQKAKEIYGNEQKIRVLCFLKTERIFDSVLWAGLIYGSFLKKFLGFLLHTPVISGKL